MRHPWSIARRVAVAQVALLAVVAMFFTWATHLQGREVAGEVEQRHLVGVATLLAQDEDLVAGLEAADPSAALQPQVGRWTADAGLSWLSVLDDSGLRVASRAPEQIGRRYPRPIDGPLAGRTVTDVSSTGEGGLSVRALAPVRAADGSGEVVGVVVVGVAVSELQSTVIAQWPQLLAAFGLMAVVSLAVAVVLHRYLTRVTLGRGPEDLASGFLLSEAAMDAVGAAVLVLSPEGTIRMHNRAAARVFGLPAPGAEEGPVPLPAELADVLARHREPEFPAVVGERMFIVQQRTLEPEGRRRSPRLAAALASGVESTPRGTRVVMWHDRTDLRRLGDELSVARTLTSALRAQTHEHANRLHTALSLIEAGRLDAAKAVLTSRADAGVDQDEVLTALMDAKTAEASEQGVDLRHRLLVQAPLPVPGLEAITLLGNLVDNALDAVSDPALPAPRRWVDVDLRCDADGLLLTVADGGAGPQATEQTLFTAGYTTKAAGGTGRGVGLALVRSVAEAAGGHVELGTDSGTVFTVEIPAAAPDAEEHA